LFDGKKEVQRRFCRNKKSSPAVYEDDTRI
jgi:hypothetical protein